MKNQQVHLEGKFSNNIRRMKRIYGIKVSQPLGDFFIAKIKARDLLEISTSSVARYNKEGKIVGNQRPLKLPRLKAIANFIKSAEMSFPTSILIAANVDCEGNIIEDLSKRWKISPTSIMDCFEIEIPNGVSSLIIDGQHRLNAFSYTEEQFKDIELVCSIFIDLPNPYQAYLFATINGNQKRVDKSLALELFGYDVEDRPSNTWSPEKLAVYLTRKFNFKNDSPLYQKIKLAPLFSSIEAITDKTKWLLSTAAMVEGIMSLISSNPQKDRDFLAMKHSLWSSTGTRSDLIKMEEKSKRDTSVLRNLYIENKDEEIYNILFKYFVAVNNILWKNAPANSVITKTIGIAVLFDILKAIIEHDGIQYSFEKYISLISDVDYTSESFSLSGGGKVKLRRFLKYKLGFLTDMDLIESDFKILQEQKYLLNERSSRNDS